MNDILERARAFTDEAIIPSARGFHARDEFPEHLVDGLGELGL